MSCVMKIGPRDVVAERARRALWEASRDGKLPQQWVFGRDVWNRLRMQKEPHDGEDKTFFGLPFIIKKGGPPDLLELDVF